MRAEKNSEVHDRMGRERKRDNGKGQMHATQKRVMALHTRSEKQTGTNRTGTERAGAREEQGQTKKGKRKRTSNIVEQSRSEADDEQRRMQASRQRGEKKEHKQALASS